MRKFVLIVILWSFAVQSLALVISPGCDMAMQPVSGAVDHSKHGPSGHADDHGSMAHAMPCCEGDGAAAPEMTTELCQLTCASGVCSLAMVTQEPLLPPVLNAAPYPVFALSPISPIPQNLLRPPRRA